jgi:transposase
VLLAFTGIDPFHEVWASYATYTSPGHQLCCAHALGELQAVANLVPEGQWCWAAEAAEALTGMQALVAEAIPEGWDADDVALAGMSPATAPPALTGTSQTAARLAS